MPDKRKARKKARSHAEMTSRTDTPELEGGTPLSEELTGRASGTDEDLTALFANDTSDHIADGFRGGSDGDADSAIPNEEDTDPDGDDVTPSARRRSGSP